LDYLEDEEEGDEKGREEGSKTDESESRVTLCLAVIAIEESGIAVDLSLDCLVVGLGFLSIPRDHVHGELKVECDLGLGVSFLVVCIDPHGIESVVRHSEVLIGEERPGCAVQIVEDSTLEVGICLVESLAEFLCETVVEEHVGNAQIVESNTSL